MDVWHAPDLAAAPRTSASPVACRRQGRGLRVALGIMLAAAIVSLCGCFDPDYPANWAPPVGNSDGCAAVTGSYANLGEFADPRLARMATNPLYAPHLADKLGLTARA